MDDSCDLSGTGTESCEKDAVKYFRPLVRHSLVKRKENRFYNLEIYYKV